MSKNFWKIFKFTQLLILIFIILTAFYISNASAENITIKLNIPSGWSMISLPVKAHNRTVSSLFPQAVAVYSYERESGYVRVKKDEELQVGDGYWMLLDQNLNYTLTGQTIHSYHKTVYEDGWEMIGGCTSRAQTKADSCDIGVIYRYVQGAGYQRVLESEPLELGKGYWILFINTSEGAEFTASTSGLCDPLTYYGYYHAESSAFGSHLDEVYEFTNLNWVRNVDDLETCETYGSDCILSLKDVFCTTSTGCVDRVYFSDFKSSESNEYWESFCETESGTKNCGESWDCGTEWLLWLEDCYWNEYIEWDVEWANMKTDIVNLTNDEKEHLVAFYLLDEPYINGIQSVNDLQAIASQIKTDYPNRAVMVVFASSSVTQNLQVPGSADWVGFDYYVSVFSSVDEKLDILRNKISSGQELFLVSQSHVVDGEDDTEIMRRNWDYFMLSIKHFDVVGLLNFGFWSKTSNPEQTLPRTFDAQENIGEMIVNSNGAAASIPQLANYLLLN